MIAADVRRAALAWRDSCALAAKRFDDEIRGPAEVQSRILLRHLRENAGTDFGREHGFDSICTPLDYRRRVPVRAYDEMLPWVERIAAGNGSVLTAAPVERLAPSSGSTRPSKLIPVTARLRADFRDAIEVWAAALHRRWPRPMCGAAYWSISPLSPPCPPTIGGVPVGFDDSGYFSEQSWALVQRTLAVPPAVALLHDVGAWQRATVALLLAREDLSMVSVWSPTFFEMLLRRIWDWRDELADSLASRVLPLPDSIDGGVRRILEAAFHPSSARADEVRAVLRVGDRAGLARRLWPRLELLSCWSDASAAEPARLLHALLPHADLQPKGLMATEGIVSIPLGSAEGACAAVGTHFLEFEDERGDVLLVHELSRGATYAVILTTAGGLHRYRLGDSVEVAGHLGETPLLRFAGRLDAVVDHAGEKLNERHVSAALAAALCDRGDRLRFALLACEQGNPSGYVLFADGLDADGGPALAHEFERRLRENFHYDYARAAGQLAELRVVVLPPGPDYAARRVMREVATGRRLGDVKPALLDRHTGWKAWLLGDGTL